MFMAQYEIEDGTFYEVSDSERKLLCSVKTVENLESDDEQEDSESDKLTHKTKSAK